MKTYENRHFEEALAKHNARAVGSSEYEGEKILLAESGPHYDPENDPMLKDDWQEYKDGYYATMAMVRGRIATWVGFCHFKANHDMNMTTEGRRKARINAAIKMARDHISTGQESGMYG